MSKIKKMFGNRIKELRVEKNLTQETLAEVAGLDQRTISHSENGRSMSMKTLQLLIDSLGVSEEEFFQLKTILDKSDDEIRAELLGIIPNLSSSDLRRLYKIVKALDD